MKANKQRTDLSDLRDYDDNNSVPFFKHTNFFKKGKIYFL